MHELGIAQSIVETVLAKMREDGYTSVSEIGLRIGVLTDIVPDALEFGFEASVRDTPLVQTRLLIERVPVKGRCRSCGNEFTVEQFQFICPRCDSREIEMTQGDELEIAYIEVQES